MSDPIDSSRRGALLALTAIFSTSLADACVPRRPVDAATTRGDAKSVRRLAEIEARVAGRLGVAVVDTKSDARLDHRSDERFPLCSTFKLLAVAAVLARVDTKREELDRKVAYDEHDLLDHAPTTKAHVAEKGMTVEALCEAAITVSDNTAGNLLLQSIGGTAGLKVFTQSLGDPLTRLDRNEPTLNEALPGDPRDTTTPAAMVILMRTLLVGWSLAEASRDRLIGWLVANTTGGERLRKAMPREWRVGDKTGTGENGTANDVAIVWPKERAPFLVVAYLVAPNVAPDERNAALAEVGRVVADWASGT